MPRNIYFDAGYRLSNSTDSRKNSATALFGLDTDNLAKLASALPYSIMTVGETGASYYNFHSKSIFHKNMQA